MLKVVVNQMMKSNKRTMAKKRKTKMMRSQSHCILMMRISKMNLVIMRVKKKNKFIRDRKFMIQGEMPRKIIFIVVLACLAHKITKSITNKI